MASFRRMLLTVDDNYSRQRMETDTYGFGAVVRLERPAQRRSGRNGTVIDFLQAGTPMDLNAGFNTDF